jgi:hypothetical protein
MLKGTSAYHLQSTYNPKPKSVLHTCSQINLDEHPTPAPTTAAYGHVQKQVSRLRAVVEKETNKRLKESTYGEKMFTREDEPKEQEKQ